VCWCAVTAAPPTSAMSQSPSRSAWRARCAATSEVLHAVCTTRAGPSSPILKAAREARKSLSFPIRTAMSPAARTTSGRETRFW
jgi:predicted component of type VI protein secretion system